MYIAKTSSATCPVFWLRKYLALTNLKGQSESFLICRLAKTKKGHNVLGHHPISYQTARKSFLDHTEHLATQSAFCLHSLRSGGASAAANNGVSDRRIGKHGRWSSSTSRDVYIKDSKTNRLSVSKNLGL